MKADWRGSLASPRIEIKHELEKAKTEFKNSRVSRRLRKDNESHQCLGFILEKDLGYVFL